MTRSLPAHPNLESDRKRAKRLLKGWRRGDADALALLRAHHPRFRGRDVAAPADLRLADAQLVVAREYGLASWPQLVDRIAERTAGFEERVALLLDSACLGDAARAAALLELDPALARAGFAVACALGDREGALAALAADPKLATQPCGPRSWQPLLYLTHSRLGAEDSACRDARCAIAERLLGLGADPNGGFVPPQHADARLSALFGATGRNDHPELAKLLLEAGADPNDGESLYHAAESMHRECLDLLVSHGVDLNRPGGNLDNTPVHFLVGYREFHPAARVADEGIRWLLEHGTDPNRPCGERRETALHAAATNGRSVALVELLAAHGADLAARRADGRTPYELAVRNGNTEVAAWLAERGADVPLEPAERLLLACGSGDEPAARALSEANPGLVAGLDAEQRALLPQCAGLGRSDAVELMLELGFPVDSVGPSGETALHSAAWNGQQETVELLLRHDPPLESPCEEFGSRPLAWAADGSRRCRNPQGDYVDIAERLIAAGASATAPANKWGSKLTQAASEEVAEVLRRHGALD